MEELKNALAELYLKHGNHEIIVDLSQILDRYIVEKQIDNLLSGDSEVDAYALLMILKKKLGDE